VNAGVPLQTEALHPEATIGLITGTFEQQLRNAIKSYKSIEIAVGR
jgi:hypothetical protein